MPGVDIIPAAGTVEKLKGPSFCFVDVDVPESGSILTLAANAASGWKTPDAGENPNAICLGKTNAGWKISSSTKQEFEFCDEFTAAEDSSITEETFELEAELRGPLNPNVIKKITSATHTPNANYDLIKGGGVSTIVPVSVCLVFRRPDAPTKYGYVLIYRAINTEGFNITELTSKKSAAMKVKFAAQADTTRPAGDQLYQIYIEK